MESTRQPRVWIVEDDVAWARFLQYKLQARGHTVKLIAEGDEVLPELRQAAMDSSLPDVIVLDLYLPGKDGVVVAGELYGDTRFRAIPLIAVTVRREEDYASSYAQQYFKTWLSKPIHLPTLIEKIESIGGERVRNADGA